MQSVSRHTDSVLIVDDDTILASLYRLKLQAAGFAVEVAESGEACLLHVAQRRPDVIVLDLMLGDMNGVDVLRMLRRNEATRELPVIVFSSAFLGGLIDEATREGANKCLNKGSCPPNRLIDELHTLLNPSSIAGFSPDSTDKPQASPQKPVISVIPSAPSSAAPPAKPPVPELQSDEVQGNLRRELLAQIDQRVEEAARVLGKWLINPRNVEAPYLPALYRAIRAVAASARLAGRNSQAELAGVLEVLLQEVKRTPDKLTASMTRTVSEAVNLLPFLGGMADDAEADAGAAPLVVVVDDDDDARELLRFALSRANLSAICLGTPEAALHVFRWNPVDLAIIDVEMPGMNGLELAERMRDSTPNADTPYVLVSGSSDVEARASRRGMNPAGFIPKPFPAIELAVKALATLYAHRKGELVGQIS